MVTTLIIIIVISLIFDFLNGFNDSANIVSSMIASRALSPRQALGIIAIAEFCGPFLLGVAVATTLGKELLKLQVTPQELPIILAAICAAVVWNLTTFTLAIPSSSSHSLVGGLIGAGIANNVLAYSQNGFNNIDDLYQVIQIVHFSGIVKVIIALLISPPLGFLAGYIILKLILFLARKATPKINWLFKRGQIITAISLALSHGSNDAQKTMGMITMALFAGGMLSEFKIPIWVVALSAGTIALGTAIGGWRLIRTLGGGLYKIRPVHGFAIQLSSAAVILGASIFGGPVSTTQVVASSVMGTGSAERFSKVRWGVGKQIFLTWIISIPSSALIAVVVYFIVRRFL
ncbi:MAG: inorganic phosphate transporter [Deltaproteobacteria bacterium]|nr:inorganic phosphate transporter [Deltaproteobacteria bacterium]